MRQLSFGILDIEKMYKFPSQPYWCVEQFGSAQHKAIANTRPKFWVGPFFFHGLRQFFNILSEIVSH